jgi:hypothetical protein
VKYDPGRAPVEHGRRLAGLLPDARLVEVADSYTLIPLDQPTTLARELRGFIRETPALREGDGHPEDT